MRAIKYVFLGALSLLPLGHLHAQDESSDRERAAELRYLPLVFQPSVFSGDEFPDCDFLEADQARKLLGDYRIQSDFYDADYNQVEKPTTTGRYGAVVTVNGANGFEFKRYRTLYRADEKPDRWSVAPGNGRVQLPGEYGIDARVTWEESRQIVSFLLASAARDAMRSHDMAVLLAGLSETRADGSAARRHEDARAQNRSWWLGLSRKLNGNASRFTTGPPAPTTIQGKPARVLQHGTPSQARMKRDAVERIDQVLSQWASDTDEPFVVCVARNGYIVFHKAYGEDQGEVADIDSKNSVASITKAMSGALLMMFNDQGLVELNDPLEKFLPEFESDGVQTSATIHHLFTHTAGMESHTGDGLVDLEHIYGGSTYPLLEVGKRLRYNGDSLGIGTRVLEQISGKTLPELYQSCLFDPLGCDDIEATNSSWDARCTALDLARFGQMLANRGAYGNQRFFSEKTFERMIPRRLTNLLGDDTKTEWGIGLTWFRNEGLSDQVVGHGSATSCTLRVDLENDLVIVMTRGARGRNFGKYHPQFIQAVADSLDQPFLHPLFADHMVLQRDKQVPIWGWARPGSSVRVSMNGQNATATASDTGKWTAQLGPFAAGGPHMLKVDGPRTVTIKDVLIGDVWICSGQSNMQWSVRASKDADAEIAAADHPRIRLFTVPRQIATSPQDVVDATWQVCSPETIANFSAVGYYFGRELHRRLDVPVGLLHTSWGGTVAEAWTSGEALDTMPDFREAVEQFETTAAEQESGGFDLATRVASWWEKNDAGTDGATGWSAPGLDHSDWRKMKLPTHWENAAAELNNFDGIVWFRREFDLPEDWGGKDLMLSLGPVDDVDTTWVNGRLVGGRQIWNQPRDYKVPSAALEPGRNVIAVRVYDNAGGGGICGQPSQLNLRLAEGGASPMSLVGEWAYKVSSPKNKLAPFPQPIGNNPNVVTVLYNGMLAPLTPYGIKGAIWYQGESNAGRPMQYRRLLPTMIKDWRARFGQGDFPFLIVQLANFMKRQEQPVESGWAELREAQLLTANFTPNVGLAVTTDIGEASDIHPRNKQDVGKRLALSALHIADQQDLVHSGPTIQTMEIVGSNLRVVFDHVGGGLVAKGDKLEGFAIAEADGEFVWADAQIEDNNTVLVSNKDLAEPIRVRYAWANNPIGNLFNKEGLPATPFRTDVPPTEKP